MCEGQKKTTTEKTDIYHDPQTWMLDMSFWQSIWTFKEIQCELLSSGFSLWSLDILELVSPLLRWTQTAMSLILIFFRDTSIPTFLFLKAESCVYTRPPRLGVKFQVCQGCFWWSFGGSNLRPLGIEVQIHAATAAVVSSRNVTRLALSVTDTSSPS